MLPVIVVFAVIIALVPAIAAVAVLGARRKARLQVGLVAWFLVANRLLAIFFARRGTVFLHAGLIACPVGRVAVVGIAGIPGVTAIIGMAVAAFVPAMVVLARIVLARRMRGTAPLAVARAVAGAAAGMAARHMAAATVRTVSAGKGRVGCSCCRNPNHDKKRCKRLLHDSFPFLKLRFL